MLLRQTAILSFMLRRGRILWRARLRYSLKFRKSRSYFGKLRAGPTALPGRHSPGLFVSQSINWVFARGLERWVERPQQRADECDERCVDAPLNGHRKGDGRKLIAESQLYEIRQRDSENDSGDGDQGRLAQHDVRNIKARRSQRFQDADFAGALHHGGVHGLKDHDKADNHCDSDDAVQGRGESGEVLGGHQRHPFLDGLYLILAEARSCQNLLPDEVLVFQVIAFDVEERGVVGIAHERAEGVDGKELAASFAVLDDAADAEWVVLDFDGVADAMSMIGAGKDVVYDDVVWTLKWASGDEDEGAQRVETFVINAPEGLHRAGHIEVGNDGCGHGNMRQPGDDIGDFGRYGRASNAGDKAGVGRAHDHVSADASGLVSGIGDLPDHDADDGEDHDDLYGDGEDADDGTQGAVQHIAEDELVHGSPEKTKPTVPFWDSGESLQNLSVTK